MFVLTHIPALNYITSCLVYRSNFLPSTLLFPRHQTEHHTHTFLVITHLCCPRTCAGAPCARGIARGEEARCLASKCCYRGPVFGCTLGVRFRGRDLVLQDGLFQSPHIGSTDAPCSPLLCWNLMCIFCRRASYTTYSVRWFG